MPYLTYTHWIVTVFIVTSKNFWAICGIVTGEHKRRALRLQFVFYLYKYENFFETYCSLLYFAVRNPIDDHVLVHQPPFDSYLKEACALTKNLMKVIFTAE